MAELLGERDAVIREIEAAFPDVAIHVRGNAISLTGDDGPVASAASAINELRALLDEGVEITPDLARRTVRMVSGTTAPRERPAAVLARSILSHRGKTIRPKTAGQAAYVAAIDTHTITFGIGPAGTGKTYLAMAQAVAALQAKRVTRILLTRPAVEAGERLGYLPGTLSEKIDPYLRPLYDALHDMVDSESIPRLIESGTIEVAPLAYMRGRTLNDAFVILDEAQNTTREQMKMFLTRLGFGSTMVVTGDVTQTDIPAGMDSGLHRGAGPARGDRRHRGMHVRRGGRGAAPPRRRDRHRLRERRRSAHQAAQGLVMIEVNNESDAAVDEVEFAELGAFVLRQMSIADGAELAILFVGTRAMEDLHVRWMDEPGPTDVLSFPMDELRPGTPDEPTPAGLLGDVVICPAVAEEQARVAGHSAEEEMLLLATHGILHLLGYDHAEPDEEREMFELQRRLLLTFLAQR